MTKSELREMIRECLREELSRTNLKESIGWDFSIEGFAHEVTDTFEDAGEVGHNIIYGKDDTDLVEVEVWESNSPVTVNANLYAPNMMQQYYDSFTAFADDLQYKCDRYLKEAAFSGGYAGDNSFSGGTVRGMGASTQPDKKNYLGRLKSKNPDLVSTMTIKGKDIKPGMITQAGQVKTAEVKDSRGEKKVYIMHTNDYDGFWCVDEDMEVMVDPEDKSKPFTGDYKELLKKGLKESATATMDWEELLVEADSLLEELCVKSDNADWDDGDGYWQEEHTTWCNRKLYYIRLNDTTLLEKLCAEYSKKLPNVEFYFYDDEDEEVSEIGYTAIRA
jgi:hypothetical protein